MEKVSIIVPVYHVKQYLRQCIESILRQSYHEIELILVDDGGDDECPQICDEYARRDPRVKCIHKRNEGQSFARRDALAIATGAYIMYVDADDWLDVETVEICLTEAEKNGADVVCFGYKRVYEKNVFETSLFDADKVFAGEEVKILHRRMIGLVGSELARVEEADRLVTMWGKLYTRQAAMKGLFISEREVGSSEDALYNLAVFAECKKCVYTHRFLYNYRKTDGNATTARYREKLPKQWQCLFEYFRKYICKNNLGIEYEEALNNRVALGMLGLGLNELQNPCNFESKADNLREILRTEQWTKAYARLEYKYFPLKWKVFYGLCKYNQTELLIIMLWIISILKSKMEK